MKTYINKVSVIIPIYNTAKYLGACLDSVLRQTHKNIEIICVDDGSTDESYVILDYYKRKDKRIILTKSKHQGQSAARNIGMRIATGDYVCFVDSDDLIEETTIYQCLDIVRKKKVSIVLFNLEAFFADGTHYPCFNGPLYTSKNPIFYSKRNRISINFTNAVAAFIERKIIIDNNLLFPEGMIYEDWVFMVKLMLSGNYKVYWHNAPLYWYRRDISDSTTASVNEKCLDLFKAHQSSKKVIDESGVDCGFHFINDEKIVSEGMGLLLSRVAFSNNNTLIEKYISNYMTILKGYPEAYFYNLISYLSEEGKRVAILFYNMPKNQAISDINKEVIRIRKKFKKSNYMIVAKHPLFEIKEFILKIVRSVSPTYRAICVTRSEVREIKREIAVMKASMDK